MRNTASTSRGQCTVYTILNPLECRDNYSATSDNMKMVHWPLMGGLLQIYKHNRTVGGEWPFSDWKGSSDPRPPLATGLFYCGTMRAFCI